VSVKLTSALIPLFLSAVALNGTGSSKGVLEVQSIECPNICHRVSVNVPTTETPRDLTVAWLEYHETGVCEDIDAEFRFLGRGLEVWCLVEDEKSYEKLKKRLAPLRASYALRVEGTPVAVEEKSPADRNPPPSLWNNEELQLYLRNWYAHDHSVIGGMNPPDLFDRTESEFGLKNRMRLFSLQILNWARGMQRRGAELPSLACAAESPAMAADLKARAAALCLAHAEEIGKNAGKLAASLSHAFPRRPSRSDDAAESAHHDGISFADGADQISRAALNLGYRVYRFVYPLDHTVRLADLREPPLLDSLVRLEETVRSFEAEHKQ